MTFWLFNYPITITNTIDMVMRKKIKTSYVTRPVKELFFLNYRL